MEFFKPIDFVAPWNSHNLCKIKTERDQPGGEISLARQETEKWSSICKWNSLSTRSITRKFDTIFLHIASKRSKFYFANAGKLLFFRNFRAINNSTGHKVCYILRSHKNARMRITMRTYVSLTFWCTDTTLTSNEEITESFSTLDNNLASLGCIQRNSFS